MAVEALQVFLVLVNTVKMYFTFNWGARDFAAYLVLDNSIKAKVFVVVTALDSEQRTQVDRRPTVS